MAAVSDAVTCCSSSIMIPCHSLINGSMYMFKPSHFFTVGRARRVLRGRVYAAVHARVQQHGYLVGLTLHYKRRHGGVVERVVCQGAGGRGGGMVGSTGGG